MADPALEKLVDQLCDYIEGLFAAEGSLTHIYFLLQAGDGEIRMVAAPYEEGEYRAVLIAVMGRLAREHDTIRYTVAAEVFTDRGRGRDAIIVSGHDTSGDTIGYVIPIDRNADPPVLKAREPWPTCDGVFAGLFRDPWPEGRPQ